MLNGFPNRRRLAGRFVDGIVFVQRDARFPAHPRHEVDHLGLVLQRHQGDDIGMRRQICAGIEEGFEARNVRGAFGNRKPVVVFRIAEDGVAHVNLHAGCAFDIPSAPAVLQGAAMVADETALTHYRHPGAVGRDGTNDESGNAHGCARLVALQADIAAVETGMRSAALIERVKHDALLRVERGEFEDVGGAHKANGNVVFEVQRAGGPRGDLRRLETGFREDEDLRGKRYIESFQHGSQVPELILILKPDGAGVELCLQARDGIVNRAFGVLNGLVVDGHHP